MHRTSRRVALVAVAAVLLTGCGRGGDDADEAADQPAGSVGEDSVLEVEDAPAAPPEAEPITYEVQDGDTLSSIARDHDVTVDAIVAANDLDDPDAIFPGDVLEIPDASEDAAGDAAADEPASEDAGDDAGDDSGDEPAEDDR